MLNSKTMRRLKSTLMIYADYESTLVVENNGMQNPKESLLTNIKKHIACIYVLYVLMISLKSLLEHT